MMVFVVEVAIDFYYTILQLGVLQKKIDAICVQIDASINAGRVMGWMCF